MPRFLELEEVFEIHRDQIERYGGDSGVRDVGLLESAIAMPQAGSGGHYFHADLFEMAAAYVFYVAKNHPFVDGNKRVAAVSALMFLRKNGYKTKPRHKALVDLVLGLVTGTATKDDAAAFFRKYSQPL